MRHTSLLLTIAALAATSCSLQLDSQYGLRWDRSIPAQRHQEAEPKHTETIAAATTVTDEFHRTTNWSEANYAQTDEAQTADQIQLIADHGESIDEAYFNEVPTVGSSPNPNVADNTIDADQHVPSEKDVLAKFGGIILLLLGIGLLWLSFFAIVVMGAYGASFGGVLFAILVTVLGILLIILGRRLYRNY